MISNAENGTVVSMSVLRGGTKVCSQNKHEMILIRYIISILWYFDLHTSQVARTFRPDFVLIRQSPRDGARDYRSLLLGLKFGGVPSINSINSVYQFQVNKNSLLLIYIKNRFIYKLLFQLLRLQLFEHKISKTISIYTISVEKRLEWNAYFCSLTYMQDKPWIFAHLLQLQRRLGKDNFPLIEQTFFPNARELVSQMHSFSNHFTFLILH